MRSSFKPKVSISICNTISRWPIPLELDDRNLNVPASDIEFARNIETSEALLVHRESGSKDSHTRE